MLDDISEEIARLELVIRENELSTREHSAWRAAYAEFDKALLIEQRDGRDASLPVYASVLARLSGPQESGPRELVISALYNAGKIHRDAGRNDLSQPLLETLIAEHFDDPPGPETRQSVADGATILIAFLMSANEWDRVYDLTDRLIRQHAVPGNPNAQHLRITAGVRRGRALVRLGRLDEAMEQFEAVLAEAQSADNPRFLSAVAGAMVGKAEVYSERKQAVACLRASRAFLRRFSDPEDTDLYEDIEWAKNSHNWALEYLEAQSMNADAKRGRRKRDQR